MKKTLIIGIGITVILLVVGLWLYLIVFGTPEESGDVFSNLGFTESEQQITIVEETVLEEEGESGDGEQLAIAGGGLQQLTTRSIAGFIYITSSTTNALRYVERGTGHIYEIDFDTSNERRVSQTTIPRVIDAVFSPDGTAVALTSVNDNSTDTFVGVINAIDTSLKGTNLPPNADNILFLDADTLYYTLETSGGTTGYRYTLNGVSQSEVFTIPLASVHVLWDPNGGSDHYVVTKPSRVLEGFLYKIKNNQLVPTSVFGRGLVTFVTPTHYFYSKLEGGVYQSYRINRVTGEEELLAITVLPEKCSSNSESLWCASPLPIAGSDDIFPEDWYKGLETSEDLLWESSFNDTFSILISDLFKESGRLIDATAVAVDKEGNRILFINRLDGTLWMYEI